MARSCLLRAETEVRAGETAVPIYSYYFSRSRRRARWQRSAARRTKADRLAGAALPPAMPCLPMPCAPPPAPST
eukprot:6186550-Pleurochrysis_carterae.AAC.1